MDKISFLGDKFNNAKSNLVILIYSFLAVISLVAIPFQNDQKRGFAFHWYILFAIITYIFMNLWTLIENINTKRIIFTILSIVLVINIFVISKTYDKFYGEILARNNSIYDQLANGDKELFVEPLKIHSSRILATREIYFRNTANTLMNNYYDVNLIGFQNSEENLGEISFSSNIKLNIENIEKIDKKIRISGWAFLEGVDSKKYNIFVLIKNIDNGNEYIYSTEFFERRDVAEFFGGPYDFTGFNSCVSEDELVSGTYQVGVVIEINHNNFGGLS